MEKLLSVDQVFYTVAEVAEKLRMSKAGVYLLANSGRIVTTKPGKHILISEAVLERYLEECRGKAVRVRPGESAGTSR
jgi:excisionase family DNA binding protein